MYKDKKIGVPTWKYDDWPYWHLNHCMNVGGYLGDKIWIRFYLHKIEYDTSVAQFNETQKAQFISYIFDINIKLKTWNLFQIVHYPVKVPVKIPFHVPVKEHHEESHEESHSFGGDFEGFEGHSESHEESQFSSDLSDHHYAPAHQHYYHHQDDHSDHHSGTSNVEIKNHGVSFSTSIHHGWWVFRRPISDRPHHFLLRNWTCE